MKPKKVSNERFLSVSVPFIVIIVVFILATTIVMNVNAQSLDTYLGMGEREISKARNSENWDVEYYEKKFATTSGANGSLKSAIGVSKSLTDEGIILMKNDGILPLAKSSKVTPFGYRYVNPIYSGTGSGAIDTTGENVVTAQTGLQKYYSVNRTISDVINSSTPVELTVTSAEKALPNPRGSGYMGSDSSIYEFDVSVYEPYVATCENTVGVVYIGRLGGEAQNIISTALYDGTPHALALSEREKNMIAFAKANCRAVIAVINSSNVMELGLLTSGDYECNAIVWVGGVGSTGFDSLADVMAGNVNPSGRTVDVWERDILSSPVSATYVEVPYTNCTDFRISGQNRRFASGIYALDYKENVYYGYRYHETANKVDYDYVYGYVNRDGKTDGRGAVIFPFGYGLSYTNFEQKITSLYDGGNKITLEVAVTNKGEVDGKEVVQIYYTSPYTEFDKTFDIEKPHKTLIAFEKVSVEAGKTENVTIEITKEDMASYCYTYNNPDGTVGCYVLESGEYVLSLGANSHSTFDKRIVTIYDTVFYDSSNPRASDKNAQAELNAKGESLGYPSRAKEDADAQFISATNRFADENAYVRRELTLLTRKDWAHTFPTLSEPRELPQKELAIVTSFDPANDSELGCNNAESKIYNENLDMGGGIKNNLVLSDMRGFGYYDSAWDDFLDQIDYEDAETHNMVFSSVFSTRELSYLGKPKTVDIDGPQGLSIAVNACGYCSEVVLASTFNVELARTYGESVGQEALINGVHGWYAPSLNVHRSPFEGRNFEYYSEDPLLSGKMASACVSGASEQGLICYIKHLGVNDFEDNSICNCCWLTEQTAREIYFKSFEICVKEARKTVRYISDNDGTRSEKTVRGCTAVMCSGPMYGATWCAANYHLITEILRGEWGFQGLVSTDYVAHATEGYAERAIHAGCDTRMGREIEYNYHNTGAGRDALRRAVKNVCYTYANSSVTDGLAPGSIVRYGMSPWAVWLLVGNIVGYTFVAGAIVIVIIRCKRHK